MSENPWKDGAGMAELSATLKFGKGYEDSWLVVRAETAVDLKKAIEEATGLSGEGMSVVDLIHNAGMHVHQVAKLGTVLGGTVVESAKAEETPAQKPQDPAGATNAAPAAQTPTLEDLIAQAPSQSALSDLFLKNKAAFGSDPALMEKLQERAKQV